MEFNLSLEHRVSAFVNKVKKEKKKEKGGGLTFVKAEILFYKSKQDVDYSLCILQTLCFWIICQTKLECCYKCL